MNNKISVRVPVDFKNEIIKICKQKGVSISEYVIAKINPYKTVPPINAVSLKIMEDEKMLDDSTKHKKKKK